MLLAEKTTPDRGCWEFQGSVWVQGEPGDTWGPVDVTGCAATAWSWMAASRARSGGLWCDSCCRRTGQEQAAFPGEPPQALFP